MKRAVRVALVAALVVVAGVTYELLRLPSAEELRVSVTTRYPEQARKGWLPLSAISPRLKEAVIAWEDPTFYDHSGFSYRATWQAAKADMREGSFARGGSTITQQVAKNLFLAREKTLRRKFDDAILAHRLEKVLSKDEILEVYLNTAEWGEGIYGAGAAAEHYFHKRAADVDWAEAALLAALLHNPRAYAPCGPKAGATRSHRDMILRFLEQDGVLDAAERQASEKVELPCT
jgi:monofunctional biosynthetic peptidoglycan transglycosylase